MFLPPSPTSCATTSTTERAATATMGAAAPSSPHSLLRLLSASSPPRKRLVSPRRSRANAATTSDAVLPSGSVVRITGNNRTKRELHDREGLVVSAQTLGGWHEVALYDGSTVRIQRNALRLLSVPAPARLPQVQANIGKLRTRSLHKYRVHHKLPLPDDCSRDELEGAVRRHFARHPVREHDVIDAFVRRLARARLKRA